MSPVPDSRGSPRNHVGELVAGYNADHDAAHAPVMLPAITHSTWRQDADECDLVRQTIRSPHTQKIQHPAITGLAKQGNAASGNQAPAAQRFKTSPGGAWLILVAGSSPTFTDDRVGRSVRFTPTRPKRPAIIQISFCVAQARIVNFTSEQSRPKPRKALRAAPHNLQRTMTISVLHRQIAERFCADSTP